MKHPLASRDLWIGLGLLLVIVWTNHRYQEGLRLGCSVDVRDVRKDMQVFKSEVREIVTDDIAALEQHIEQRIEQRIQRLEYFRDGPRGRGRR